MLAGRDLAFRRLVELSRTGRSVPGLTSSQAYHAARTATAEFRAYANGERETIAHDQAERPGSMKVG